MAGDNSRKIDRRFKRPDRDRPEPRPQYLLPLFWLILAAPWGVALSVDLVTAVWVVFAVLSAWLVLLFGFLAMRTHWFSRGWVTLALVVDVALVYGVQQLAAF